MKIGKYHFDKWDVAVWVAFMAACIGFAILAATVTVAVIMEIS